MDFERFPGYIGSRDCQHWNWKNCPFAQAGRFQGKGRKLIIVFKAITVGKLWMWGCNFGNPGSMNDINTLNSASSYQDILKGKMIPNYKYSVSGKNMIWYTW